MGVKQSVIPWLTIFLVVVWGQTSNVQQCIPSYNWTLNQRGQTPCLVAAYLESGCGMAAIVDAMPPGAQYIGPSVAIADGCYCNSVTYSLISACAGCQDRSYLNWTTWSYNCSVRYEASFPGTMLVNTSVPQWAYLNVSQTNDTFDPVVAARNVSITLPSSLFPTATVASTSTVLLWSSSSIPSTTTTRSSSNAMPTDVGAIIGGVLGGSVGVVILLLISIAWFIRRRAYRTQKDLIFDKTALVSPKLGASTPLGRSPATVTFKQNTIASPLLNSPYLSNSSFLTSSSLDAPSTSIRYAPTLQPNRYRGFGADST